MPNVNPLNLHFHLVKLGLTGIDIIFFLCLLENIDCGYSLEPPRRGETVLASTQNLCLEQKCETYPNFYLKIFIFGGNTFSIFEKAC